MTQNDLTESILNNDPVNNTEKLIKKTWEQFNTVEETFMIGSAFIQNQQKAEYLKSIGDTYYCMPWDDFIQLIQKNGFKEGLKYEFNPKPEYEDCIKTEEAIIYYRPDGLIIWATSYDNKVVVNGGKLYGFIETKNLKNEPETNNIMSRCSHDSWRYYGRETNEMVWRDYIYFIYDIREALIYTINKIHDKANFISPWPERPFLWFLDYNDEHIPGYDYLAINDKKISMCCSEVQHIILGKLQNEEKNKS
jgi:hypothetical protein